MSPWQKIIAHLKHPCTYAGIASSLTATAHLLELNAPANNATLLSAIIMGMIAAVLPNGTGR